MRIEALADHPEQAATLARWHHAQWAHLYLDWTLQVASDELAGHAASRGLPTTLVLLDGDELQGSVSLVLEDAPDLQHLGSPWLASLYVRPEARGRGFGKALVLAAERLAAAQGVPRLWLFTPGHAGFYRRLGWSAIADAGLRGTAVSVLAIEPRQAAA